jgi:hypothetical protein
MTLKLQLVKIQVSLFKSLQLMNERTVGNRFLKRDRRSWITSKRFPVALSSRGLKDAIITPPPGDL